MKWLTYDELKKIHQIIDKQRREDKEKEDALKALIKEHFARHEKSKLLKIQEYKRLVEQEHETYIHSDSRSREERLILKEYEEPPGAVFLVSEIIAYPCGKAFHFEPWEFIDLPIPPSGLIIKYYVGSDGYGSEKVAEMICYDKEDIEYLHNNYSLKKLP